MNILGIIASSYPRAAGAFESIASASGTGSSQNITFSSIPSTYTSLQLRGIFRSSHTATVEDIRVRFNSDTGTNYASHFLTGDGSATAVDASASTTLINIGRTTAASAAADIVSGFVIDIHDYTSTARYKTLRALGGLDRNGSGNIYMSSGLWMSTSAITSITFNLFSGNWTTQTQIALYGIKGA